MTATVGAGTSPPRHPSGVTTPATTPAITTTTTAAATSGVRTRATGTRGPVVGTSTSRSAPPTGGSTAGQPPTTPVGDVKRRSPGQKCFGDPIWAIPAPLPRKDGRTGLLLGSPATQGGSGNGNAIVVPRAKHPVSSTRGRRAHKVGGLISKIRGFTISESNPYRSRFISPYKLNYLIF